MDHRDTLIATSAAIKVLQGASIDRDMTLDQGRYHLKRLIGAGASGRVFEARDDHNKNHPVALKIVPLDLAWQIKDFDKEAATLRAMHTEDAPACADCVSCMYDAFRLTAGEHSYGVIVMELMEGSMLDLAVDLELYLRKGNSATPDTNTPARAAVTTIVFAQMMERCARCLDWLHTKKGSFHMDIKPQNILFKWVASDRPGHQGRKVPVLRFADMGLTCIWGKTPCLPGTPDYVPPDIASAAAQRQDVDADTARRIDCYALAVSLHEVLHVFVTGDRRQKMENMRAAQRDCSTLIELRMTQYGSDIASALSHLDKVLRAGIADPAQVHGGWPTLRQCVEEIHAQIGGDPARAKHVAAAALVGGALENNI